MGSVISDFDVISNYKDRVSNPNAPSNRSIHINKLYVTHETKKNVKYEDRIVQV